MYKYKFSSNLEIEPLSDIKVYYKVIIQKIISLSRKSRQIEKVQCPEIYSNVDIHLMYPISHEDGKIGYLLNVLKQLSVHFEIKRCLP